MIQLPSDEYIDHLERIKFISDSGRLISLLKIYNDYGMPKNKSPQEVLMLKSCRNIIRDEIERSSNAIEKVIRFDKTDVLVNLHIAFKYLNFIDDENYKISLRYLDVI